MIDIKKILSKKIRSIYYYVPPCPACGSPITGRYVKLHRNTETEWQINEALRHGELIRPLYQPTARNCFCANCRYEWIGTIETRLISYEDLQKEKTQRLTREILNQRINDMREMEKKDHSLLKPVKRFIGKL